MPEFDVVGVGLNATDTLLVVPHFPAYAGKVPFQEEILSPGGQVASALVACAHLGLRAKYIGAVGDDERGCIQMESLRATGINLDDVQLCVNCANQSAYIIIDRSTGERTVLWRHDDCLRIDPERIAPEHITGARMLHIDGFDTLAAARAAEIARRHGIPVTVDVDTMYHGFERVLPNVDYLVASSEFPAAWTGVNDPLQALETAAPPTIRRAREQRSRTARVPLIAANTALCLRFTRAPSGSIRSSCRDPGGPIAEVRQDESSRRDSPEHDTPRRTSSQLISGAGLVPPCGRRAGKAPDVDPHCWTVRQTWTSEI